MTKTSPFRNLHSPRPLGRRLAAALLVGTLALTGCSTATAGNPTGSDVSESAATNVITDAAASDTEGADGSLFDADAVHTVSLEVDADVLTDVLATYADSGTKKWASATVTIDGVTYENVGIKLKGNSSLRGVTTSSKAETLPWRIRLDKYVDGQNAGGYSDFTIRGNSSSTSMNEAVALELLAEAGLATELSAETRFSVNGSDAVLRLAVQNLDETWAQENFPDAGADSVLYKSDADGNWSWRGEDGDYTSSFDIEAGPDNYAPLIELLDLVNNGTDEEKLAKLPELVDLDSLATYLAFEDLIGNFDDIDGPGNNSYLFWDSATEKFTVVAWDHNLAFGGSPGGGSGFPGRGQGGAPGGGFPGNGNVPGRGGAAGGDTTDGDAGNGSAGTGDTPSDENGADGDMGNGGTGNGGTSGDGNAADGTTADGDASSGDAPTPPDGADGMTPPTDMPAPGNGDQGGQGQGRPAQDGQGRGGMPGGQSNPLVESFNAVADWAALQTAATTKLQSDLIDSGARDASVDRWESLLASEASDLVDAATIASEADAIRTFTPSSR